MRSTKWSTLMATLTIMTSVHVYAQPLPATGTTLPETQKSTATVPIALNSDGDEDQEDAPSPSDVIQPSEKVAKVCDHSCDVICNDSCCAIHQDHCSGKPWRLFAKRRGGISAGGWVNFGATLNGHGNESVAGNSPLEFNNMSDGILLNQLWAWIGKDANTNGCGTDWGFRFDYLFGTDAPDAQTFGDAPHNGWDNSWNSSRDYGSAIPQLYGEVAIDNLSIKAGHFYSLVGYEAIPGPENFFYTHSYTMYYGEPRTHVGALAEYDAGRGRTVYGGWTAGWDNGFDNFHDASTFLGGIGVERDNATITWIVIAGDIGTDFTFAGKNDSYMNSIVVDFAITDRLMYVLQHDLGVVSSSSSQKAEWYGLNQYLLYNINDCWAAGLRFEWFRDDDGVRVDPNQDGLNTGNYYELTAGLNWRPHTNINVRPELRWDWYDGRGNKVYDDGDHNRLFTASIDAILTF